MKSKKPERPSFVYVTYIATTPQKLWKALTSKTFLQKIWYGCRMQSDWKIGSPVQTIKPDGGVDWDGKLLKYDRPRLLSYTFQILGYQKRSSRVVFEIERVGSTVKLTFTHYGIEARCKEGISEGWSAYFSTLKSMLETGHALKIPG